MPKTTKKSTASQANTVELTAKTESADVERERLVSLINSMADGVIATDEAGRIVLYNGAALNILDVNTNLHKKRFDDVTEITDNNNQPVNFTEMITATKTQTSSRDLKIKYPDSSTSNLYSSIAPVRLGFGKEGNRGFVVLLRDITREKSLEEERDEFISVISHELRTPIAIAEGNIGNAEFIVEKARGDENIRNTLKVAHDQILFLAGMINDLSTLSRAERGKLTLDIEKINILDLFKDLKKEYSPQAKKKDLVLHASVAADVEALCSSKLYVREILQNFVTNAIKYTESGSVTIAAHHKKGGVMFEIIDTGIGISKTDQERVFDKFFRSEDFRTRANSGTGLGLYITMKLSRLIHAEVELHSVLNKGSTFSIFMPNLK